MGHSETTYTLRQDGMYEVHHSYTSYKGSNAGNTSTSLDRVISGEEYSAILEAGREETRKREANRIASLKKEEELQEWVKNLPTLGDWFSIDKNSMEVVDHNGNYVCGLRGFFGKTANEILARCEELAQEEGFGD